jgi:hypothetical protein
VATIIQAVSAELIVDVSAKAGVAAVANPANANRLAARDSAPMIFSPALHFVDRSVGVVAACLAVASV